MVSNGTIANAHKLIADACLIEYEKAQVSKSGKRYKKHRPYTVPEWCINLQGIIQTDNEHAIKAAMAAARQGCYSLI